MEPKIVGLRIKKSGNYWEPSKTVRALGFATRTLSKDVNRAKLEAEQFNAEVKRYRLRLDRGEFKAQAGTLGFIMGLYRADEDFTTLSKRTQDDYRMHMKALESDFGDARLEAITPPVVKAYKLSMADHKPKANRRLAVLSLLFSLSLIHI